MGVSDRGPRTYGFDLVLGQRDDAVQGPPCARRRLAVTLCLLDFLICKQQIDTAALHEIDVVRPSVVSDEAHKR